MTAEPAAIVNARIVLPDEVVDGSLLLAGGRVAGVRRRGTRPPGRVIDAGGRHVLPALVDLHTDALERHARPRPGAWFEPRAALVHAERELAAAGIGTPLHAIGFLDATPDAARHTAALAYAVSGAAAGAGRVRHGLHVRCELPETALVPVVAAVVESCGPALVSLMDHTPGRGQFRDAEDYRRYLERRGVGREHVTAVLSRLHARAAPPDGDRLRPLLDAARRAGALLASHDDDDPERLRALAALGVGLAEFPVTRAAARAARELGLPVCMGAPNVVRGRSSAGNLSALEAIGEGLVDALCSDYYPPSLLHAAFALAEGGHRTLAEAVALVSAGPAGVAGLEPRGLVEGAPADVILVDASGPVPVTTRLLVGGRVAWPAT